jgi:hypothetical protein
VGEVEAEASQEIYSHNNYMRTSILTALFVLWTTLSYAQTNLTWDEPLDSDYELTAAPSGIRSFYATGFNTGKGAAASVQTISSGEALVFNYVNSNNFFAVGLSTTKPKPEGVYGEPVGNLTIPFGMFCGWNNNAGAYEAGTTMGTQQSLTTPTAILWLRINYVGSQIRYEKSTNGTTWTLFYTSATIPSGAYYVIFHSPAAGAGPSHIYKIGTPANQPPLVNAGIDQAVILPASTTTLNGTSSDPDGTISATVWSKLTGPTGGTITTNGNDTTGITALQEGTYTFELAITDNSAATTRDTISVVVYPADPLGTTITTPSIIPFSDPEIITAGRGAEEWNYQAYVPLGTEPIGAAIMHDAYFRWQWYKLETASGVYNWTDFDKKVKDAINKGQTFSFGIMSVCDGCGTGAGDATITQPSDNGAPMGYPLYLHALMQSSVDSLKDWISPQSGHWVPNYNNAYFLARTKSLCDSINNHLNTTSYNGVLFSKVINYIDIRHVGSWGEWNQSSYISNVSDFPTARRPKAFALDSIISYYVRGFWNHKTVINVAAFDAEQVQNTWHPAEVAYFALTTQNARGKVGWRRDQWGDIDRGAGYVYNWTLTNYKTYGGIRFDTVIMNRWRTAQVLGEPPGYQTLDVPDLKNLPKEVKQFNAASFGNGNIYTQNTYNPALVPQGTRDSVRMASKLAGFRNQVEQFTSSTYGVRGESFIITANWHNIGYAPLYDPFHVEYELRKAGDTVVWTGRSGFRLQHFLPASSATSYIDTFEIDLSVPVGTYSLHVIIRDSLGYRRPLALANTGRLTDGSYLIRPTVSIVAGAGNTPPTVNAGTDQTIAADNTAVSGSATDLDGSVASYSWQKLSGSGGTISTPTLATTNITGLSAGIYTYRLTATDNLGLIGTDDVQITVNAPGVVYINLISKAWYYQSGAYRLKANIKFNDNTWLYITQRDGYYVTGVRQKYENVSGTMRLVCLINYANGTVQKIINK